MFHSHIDCDHPHVAGDEAARQREILDLERRIEELVRSLPGGGTTGRGPGAQIRCIIAPCDLVAI